MNRGLRHFFIISFIWVSLFGYAYAVLLPKYFTFDKKDALSEWTEKIFHGRVHYEVKPTPDKVCLQAASDRSSSGLFYRLSFNPKKYPYISWNWKVSKFPLKSSWSDLTKKGWVERDDYAVRVYVIFPAFIFTNTKCLEYVWAQDLPRGKILTSPFFRNIKLIVVESGLENMNKWVHVERNIAEDYKRAFGSSVPKDTGAIALMTDADNTQSSALGYYADIKVGYQKAETVNRYK